MSAKTARGVSRRTRLESRRGVEQPPEAVPDLLIPVELVHALHEPLLPEGRALGLDDDEGDRPTSSPPDTPRGGRPRLGQSLTG